MTKEEESILNTNYEEKYNKRTLESNTKNIILNDTDTEKGDIFGIVGPAVKEHVLTWGELREKTSKFIILEKEKEVYNKMVLKKKEFEDPNTLIAYGDLFNTLSRIRSTKKNPLNFVYGHLDFCITAHRLKFEFDLYKNLCWMSRWKKLNSTFWLDVSFSTRTDMKKDRDDNSFETVMEEEIPFIFNRYGWEVINVRPNKKGNFANKYQEPHQCPMVNALYKLIKKNKKSNEIKNAYVGG